VQDVIASEKVGIQLQSSATLYKKGKGKGTVSR